MNQRLMSTATTLMRCLSCARLALEESLRCLRNAHATKREPLDFRKIFDLYHHF